MRVVKEAEERRNEILDVAKKTKVIVSTEQTLINGEEEKKTSDSGSIKACLSYIAYGLSNLHITCR